MTCGGYCDVPPSYSFKNKGLIPLVVRSTSVESPHISTLFGDFSQLKKKKTASFKATPPFRSNPHPVITTWVERPCPLPQLGDDSERPTQQQSPSPGS